MIKIEIPGKGLLQIDRVVLDLNGTLSLDGKVSDSVKQRIKKLASMVRLHLLTTDTHGTAKNELHRLPITVEILADNSAKRKAEFVQIMGKETIAVVGNGYNDHLMMDEACFSVAVLWREGASPKSLLAADLVVNSPESALDLFIYPRRIVASLRD
jgi:P-type E1-E2 ATPase